MAETPFGVTTETARSPTWTVQVRLECKRPWTSSVFFDADNDGDEDLFLGHFVAFDPTKEPECRYGGGYHYCHPLSYEPASSSFYINNGDGTFADRASNPASRPSKGAVGHHR